MPILIARNERPLGSLFEYRDLVYLLVRVEFVSKFKQTALGPLWFLLQPVLMSGIFVGVFSRVIRLPHEGSSPWLFYFSGLIIWGYFSQSLASVASCLSTYGSLLRKVYFPRIALPLSMVLAKLLPFSLQFLLFAVCYATLAGRAGTSALFYLPIALPLVLVQLAAAGLGLGLCLAAFSVRYRDAQHALGFLLQVGMYVSPVLYSPAQLPAALRTWAYINPVAGPIGLLRFLFFRSPVDPFGLLLSFSVAWLVFAAGLFCFRSIQARFIDIL